MALLATISLLSWVLLVVGRNVLAHHRPLLNRWSSPALLSRTARYSPDPSRRRQARLVLAAASGSPDEQLYWLAGQAWGQHRGLRTEPSVVLALSAIAEQRRGQKGAADVHWRNLLLRFPDTPTSADSRYWLGAPGDALHEELLERFPAHPSSLASALTTAQTAGPRQLDGALHLARWGPRQVGSEHLLADLCFQQGSQLPTAAAAVLAAALLQVDNPAAAEACQPGVAESGSATDDSWPIIRELLLQRSWSQAQHALASAASAPRLTLAEAIRLDFWHGFVQQQLGQPEEAQRLWHRVTRLAPWSYYGWRSQVRLGQAGWPSPLQWVPAGSPAASLGRTSRDDAVTWLWNTGLEVLAWEHWRHWRSATAPQDPDTFWIEGQLRLAVMDPWMGLEQLDAASWSRSANEGQLLHLEQVRHPIFYGQILAAAARRHGLDPALLLATARQESRFRPAQRSVVGALGLLQIMPATAAQLLASTSVPADLADQDLETQLLDAEINADLGARYLAQQLRNWRQQPIPAIASYNAGPAAVASWDMDGLEEQPELWIEAIPYDETRLYVKTVLGSWWAYSCLHGTPCLPSTAAEVAKAGENPSGRTGQP
ncbi:MAG: hypothetical protein TE42_04070 [Candidatus Synechococcus spongiarum SP3]|uniref:Transglycosylase SLT domain-containing protein n=1 Tax=Candidatus Synechococcus spongiarum SP3 TaxID=1604020 RepID=A0A0G2J534_9SYNE|nr:MAG: hypothetical protein TE42_04070 [Candidatus Synechococcus spongiarum SP3]